MRGCKNGIDDRSNIFPWLGGSNLPPWTIFTKASQIHIFNSYQFSPTKRKLIVQFQVSGTALAWTIRYIKKIECYNWNGIAFFDVVLVVRL